MDFLTLGVLWPIILATGVALCYVIARKKAEAKAAKRQRIDVDQAQEIITELEEIWQHVRRNLAGHQATVLRFKERIESLRDEQTSPELQEIADEAARVLQPTQRFNDEICSAYEAIRKQADMLSQLGSTGTTTGKPVDLSSCSFQDIGTLLFPQNKPISTPLCVAVFGVRNPLSEDGIDRMRHVDRILRLCMRPEDIITQYSETEFAVYMPEIALADACHHSERMQTVVQESLPITLDGGVAEAHDSEELASVMSRVDAALYSASTSETGCVYEHSGSQIRMLRKGRDKAHHGENAIRAPLGQPLRSSTKRLV